MIPIGTKVTIRLPGEGPCQGEVVSAKPDPEGYHLIVYDCMTTPNYSLEIFRNHSGELWVKERDLEVNSKGEANEI